MFELVMINLTVGHEPSLIEVKLAMLKHGERDRLSSTIWVQYCAPPIGLYGCTRGFYAA